MVLANSGKRWFVACSNSHARGLKLHVTEKKGHKRFELRPGKALLTKICQDLSVPERGIIELSQDREPSEGLMWFELLSHKG